MGQWRRSNKRKQEENWEKREVTRPGIPSGRLVVMKKERGDETRKEANEKLGKSSKCGRYLSIRRNQ